MGHLVGKELFRKLGAQQKLIIEWIELVLAMMIVLSAELFNTSIENAMDRVSTEQHPLAKVAKDTAAGAVLITAIGSVVIGVLIFGPKLLALLTR